MKVIGMSGACSMCWKECTRIKRFVGDTGRYRTALKTWSLDHRIILKDILNRMRRR
jgi:hypothetical protein